MDESCGVDQPTFNTFSSVYFGCNQNKCIELCWMFVNPSGVKSILKLYCGKSTVTDVKIT